MRAGFGVEKRSTLSWLWQAATGVLLLPLLALHIIANHFVVTGGERNFAEVASYLGNPVIKVLEVLFLLVVTSHAMLGVRSILFDMGVPRRSRPAVSWAVTALGVVTVAYGIWLTITISP
ncbi:MAG TPA: succinate dehydrogenase, hydrophobic membrane anchor protein [Candidatus Nanopelagicaceae bacterium]|nr:succinate dehydrogenase, hydrophobic membrane anchor protein [Candidatus Nanopelagicaceae bacterium]